MTARILVIGCTGQLGQELSRVALPQGLAMIGLGRKDIDLTDVEAVARAISNSNCALVVNAAAYTAVDTAEREPEQAFAINRDAPGYIAEACKANRTPLLHISTDYVFDGTKESPYVEDDPVRPLGVYGASKAAGENAVRQVLHQHVIVRTSWLFSAHGRNFVKTMLRLAQEKEELAVVDDQWGCPTAAGDLAVATIEIARQILQQHRTDAWGTYHFAGQKPTSWYGFARAIFESREALTGQDAPRLRPTTSSEYPTAARRPPKSVLDCSKISSTYRIYPERWRDGLSKVLRQLLWHRE